MIPAIGALIYFFFPYGLLSLLIIPIIVLFGLWQHRSAAIRHFRKSADDAIQGIQPPDGLFDEEKNSVDGNETKLLPQTKKCCNNSRKHQIGNGCF